MVYKVLLVDDDPRVISGYFRALRREKSLFQIITAGSAREGLQLIQQQGPFAVIITDYCMPEMDGIEFLALVRQRAPESARVILTGKAGLEMSIEAVNRGSIFYFLTKPCPTEKLRQVIMTGIQTYCKNLELRGIPPAGPGAAGEKKEPGVIVVKTLGAFRVFCGDREIPEKAWRNPKVKELFRYLLVHRHKKVEKDLIFETFWPGKDIAQAANNFSTSLYYLRQALRALFPKEKLPGLARFEKGYCWLEMEGYVLQVDADEFLDKVNLARGCRGAGETAQAVGFFKEALALYRGKFLEEFLYDEWLEPQRERLHNTWIQVQDELAYLLAREKNYDEAVLVLKTALFHEPYREELYYRLIQVLMQARRKAEATVYYERCRQVLNEEFGLEPDQGIRRLLEGPGGDDG